MIRSSGPLLQRLQSAHESRTASLEHRRAKASYDARLDKKMCRKCGAEQSYDEVRSHKNKCQTCKEPFRHRLLWQEVGDEFLSRQESKLREREEKIADLETKTAHPFQVPERLVYDSELNVSRKLRPAVARWEEVQTGFMTRMETDARRREVKRVLAEQAAMDAAGCTFQPTLTARSESDFGLDATFEERMERDAVRRHRERAMNALRAEHQTGSIVDCTASLRGKAAWDSDQLEFSGGIRRNPSGRWL